MTAPDQTPIMMTAAIILAGAAVIAVFAFFAWIVTKAKDQPEVPHNESHAYLPWDADVEDESL